MAHHHDLSIITRDASPAASDTSNITIFSRSPSPVSDYEVVLSQPNTPTATVGPSPHRLRDSNGRFSPQKSQRKLPGTHDSSPRQTRRARALEVDFPTPASKDPIPWVAGQGGFGTMGILPREVRQMIYGYAFDSRRGKPVTVRECCGPDITERVRDACRKHGLLAKRDSGRFNILQVSKAMKVEASWVVYLKTALLLDMNESMAPYIPGFQSSKSLRLVGDSLLTNKRKSVFWTIAGRFRYIHLRVPESTVKYGVPVDFTGYLLRTTIIFCKLWEQVPPPQPGGIVRFVRVHLDSMFQEMLPFNMESQAAARYGELLDWLCRHSPTAEPDFDRAASECAHNLQCMLNTAGKYPGRYKWDVIVRTLLDKRDEGGLEALREFQNGCEKNGVEIVH